MRPYFYKLLHKPSGKIYVGSQYGKTANPENLWNTYFTSSKVVCSLVEEFGVDSFEVLCVKERNDAREYESRYLKHAYRMLGKDRFASLLLNKNIAPGILLDASMIKKANSDEKRRKNKEAAIKRVKDGTHNFITSPYKKTEEDRKKLSQRMKGNNIGSKRKMTDEYRALAAKNSRGNTNVRGSRWWTNGVVYKRAKECPGDDFYLGSPPQSEETKRKRSLALTGNKNRRIQNKT